MNFYQTVSINIDSTMPAVIDAFDVEHQRSQFPAFSRSVNGRPAVYFDGPAGSQVPQAVVDAVGRYLVDSNANHGGLFATSQESDALLDQAHQAAADFVGATDPAETYFGANMTSLTFALSRALARTWQPGDEVMVTRLDHDANVTPWVLAAQDAGATVQRIGIRQEDCTLDLDDFRKKLSSKTKLVAIGCASNAVGTINPVAEMVRMAHEVGALVFLDAVHFAPHGLIDVTAWDCDFLACSAYKFFGPHVGVMWGKRRHLEQLNAYKLRPAPNELPGRWMTGTQNHEGIAGVLAAIDYMADLGRTGTEYPRSRREALAAGYRHFSEYERGLGKYLLKGLLERPELRVWGITDPERVGERVTTFAFTHARRSPREIAEKLGREGIFVWHGNYYALPLTETLGLEPDGMVRVGLLHYNTAAEVDRLLTALRDLA